VLELEVTVEPEVVSLAPGSLGYARIVVTARNPRPTSVNVQRSTYSGRTFAVRLRGPVSSIYLDAWQSDWSATWFAPGETKRQVFDFYASGLTVPFGEWRIEPEFMGRVGSSTRTFRITP
jgi:hypothetical protein